MGGVTLVALPYDSGRFNERMGRGSASSAQSVVWGSDCERQQRDVEVVTHSPFRRIFTRKRNRFGRAPETERSTAIREAHGQEQAANLILSGNCGPAALSAVSAIGSGRLE